MSEATAPGIAPSQTVGPFFLDCLLRPDARRNVLVQPATHGRRIRIEGRVLDGDGLPVPDAVVEIWQANAAGRYHHPADTGNAARGVVNDAGNGVRAVNDAGNGGGVARAEDGAESASRPLDPAFIGFGRSGTDDDGRYWFETIRPGPVPFDGARAQAPHIAVMVHARGLLNHLATRLYFADEAANAVDPVLQRVPADRRATLLARRVAPAGGVVNDAGNAAGGVVNDAGNGQGNDTPLYRFDIVLQGVDETVFFNL